MYAETLGVDPRLEESAKWITWADQEHFQAHNDDNAAYNLRQFWAQKDKDASQYPDLMRDLVYMDALSHRILAYQIMRAMTVMDPSNLPSLTVEMQNEFSLAASEFAEAGHAEEAAHDTTRAAQAESDAAQIETNFVDDTYVTAFRDQYNKVLDATGSAISGAGKVLSFLGNPIVLAGIAGLALWWAFGRRK